MKFFQQKKRPLMINIVSLIDILTILLIFFIVTTTFKKDEPEVEITLPESSTAKKSQKSDEPTIIYATREKRIFIGKDQIGLQALPDFLRNHLRREPQAKFALKADTDVPLGFFVKVLDASKNAGIPHLSLFTEPPKKQAP